ncbi:MAG: N-acetylmuramoyl-L-alanine amidase [Eubacteriales bacterium]|nr:N-acetylmuramoyl-L-alanine amidase [Eubacteriales bacterium]
MRRRKKRIRANRLKEVIALTAAVAVVTIIIIAVSYNLDNIPTKLRAEVNEIEEIPIITDFILENTQGRPGHLRKIKYIVIHETGNRGRNANAASHNNYLHTEADNQQKSWHYTVDDHEIYYHIPDNEIAFHAGDGLSKDGGNLNGIGIEMCVNPENDYELTLQNTAKLAAMLLEAYDLDIRDVKKHEDFSGKNCPEILLKEGRWDEFVEMVKLEHSE